MAQPPPLRESPILQEAAIALNYFLCLQDSNLSVYTNNPDLTPCFQNSLLAWVPCIYLWATLPCYLLYLRHHHRGYITLSHLSKLKTVRSSGLFGWGWDLGEISFNESLARLSAAGQGSPASPPGGGLWQLANWVCSQLRSSLLGEVQANFPSSFSYPQEASGQCAAQPSGPGPSRSGGFRSKKRLSLRLGMVALRHVLVHRPWVSCCGASPGLTSSTPSMAWSTAGPLPPSSLSPPWWWGSPWSVWGPES